jgi:hypothetical protein
MDNTPQLGTAADLEMRAARIADPGIGTCPTIKSSSLLLNILVIDLKRSTMMLHASYEK